MIVMRKKKRGLSPVISTIILSAAVITIGGILWSYAQGASTVIANSYVNDTIELLNEVTERFAVEHVSNNSDGTTLYVWMYNYGDVDVIVDVYSNASHYVNATYTSYVFCSNLTNSINSDSLNCVEIDFSSSNLVAGDEVAVQVHSRRQNDAYYKYNVQ